MSRGVDGGGAVTLRRVLEEGAAFLERRDVPDAALDAWYLMEQVWQLSRASYYAHRDEPMGQAGREAKLSQYKGFLERRGMREPLQHILGRAWFMELELTITPHVLVPRQDTEILAEEARKRLHAGDQVLDIGTGSGCILLSLLYACPGAEGTGTDISPEALETARGNSRRLGIPARWICSDLFCRVEGNYHMIVSNPPYIPSGQVGSLMEEVSGHDPRLALDGGEDGLDFYRVLLVDGLDHLLPGGVMLLEVGVGQGDWVRSHMEALGYRQVQAARDLSGRERVVLGYR